MFFLPPLALILHTVPLTHTRSNHCDLSYICFSTGSTTVVSASALCWGSFCIGFPRIIPIPVLMLIPPPSNDARFDSDHDRTLNAYFNS